MFRSLLMIALLCSSTNSWAKEAPNILLIVADDLCWKDLGFTGNPDVKTPHLDQLRTESMSLTQMFSPASMCSPSRHALYTGLYCVRAGAYPNHTQAYAGTRSLFTHLKSAGYRVALQGKEHIGPPKSFPYEKLAGKKLNNFASTREFITRDRLQPWFLVFASHDPHTPWNQGPQEKYSPNQLTIPEYLHDDAQTRQLLAQYYAEITHLDAQTGKLMQLLSQTSQKESTLVVFVSEQGNAFPYGGKWSLYDNGIRVTALFRWPGHIAKNSTSAALVQYPDVAPTLLEAIGMDPTEIDTGCPDVEGNTGFDGQSFWSVLTGQSDTHREQVFAQHTTVGVNGYREPYPMRAVRTAEYKLIWNLASYNEYHINGIHEVEPFLTWQEAAKTDQDLKDRVKWLSQRPDWELYDVQNDPEETQNLAAESGYQEKKQELEQHLRDWMKQQGDDGLATELKALSRQKRGKKQTAKSSGK